MEHNNVVISTTAYAPDDVCCYFFMTLPVTRNDCVIMIVVGLISYESCISAFERSSSLLKSLDSTLCFVLLLHASFSYSSLVSINQYSLFWSLPPSRNLELFNFLNSHYLEYLPNSYGELYKPFS